MRRVTTDSGRTPAWRRLLPASRRPGLLSVVVPVYNVEDYLDECLVSLTEQDYANIEIVIVDDGSTDASGHLARSWVRRDHRIRLVRQPNKGLSAARNTGVRHARGEYLAFVDSDDVVEQDAYADAIATLARTGSDFAVMPYRRIGPDGIRAPRGWIRAAHRVRRERATLASAPGILVNVVAWTKVYRREFWDAAGITFPVGRLYEDQVSSMAAYARARRFDILTTPAVRWRIRDNRSSITQQFMTAPNIAGRHRAARDSLEVLAAAGHDWAVAVRAAQTINNTLIFLFTAVAKLDDAAWAELSRFASFLVDAIGERAVWDTIDARNKVVVHLCARGHREDAERFVSDGSWSRHAMTATVVGDEVHCRFAEQERLSALVPGLAFVATRRETPLTAALHSVRRDGDTLEFVLTATIRGFEPHAADRVAIAPTTMAASGPGTVDPDHPERVVARIPTWMFQGAGRHPLRVTRSGRGVTRSAVVTAAEDLDADDAWGEDDGRILALETRRGRLAVTLSENAESGM